MSKTVKEVELEIYQMMTDSYSIDELLAPINLLFEEMLEESGVIASGGKRPGDKTYWITADPDRGSRYSDTPYFKLNKKDGKVARIPIKPNDNGDYIQIYHPGGEGDEFSPTQKELRILDKILAKPSNSPGPTNWNNVILAANKLIMAENRKVMGKLIPEDQIRPIYEEVLQSRR